MARQSGIIKLKGTMGDVSFYRTKDGYLARERGGVEKSRIENDPAFQRTRENGAEFGRAGASGRILRMAFKPLLQRTSDGRRISRLTQEMMKVIQADTVNLRGERNVTDGNLALLTGFEFNISATLGSMLSVSYTASVDRESGEARVVVPAIVPQESIVAPQGATHCKFVSAAAEIDFAKGTFNMVGSSSPEVLLGVQEQAELSLTNALPAASVLPLFLVFGIEFYQEVNGVFYPLKNGTHNALTLVSISLPAAG